VAILDLGKTIIKPQIEGVMCPKCGGELNHTKIKAITVLIVKTISLGKINLHSYSCNNCTKSYYLF
jgi:uncharacterized protein with PIN domain